MLIENGGRTMTGFFGGLGSTLLIDAVRLDLGRVGQQYAIVVYFQDDLVPEFFALDGTLLYQEDGTEDEGDLPPEHWLKRHTWEFVHPAITPEAKEAVIKMGVKYGSLRRWYGQGLCGILSHSMIEAINADFRTLVEGRAEEGRAEGRP